MTDAGDRLGEVDIVRMYFDDAGRIPLLTAEGEVELAQRMEAARTGQDVMIIAALGEYAVEESLPVHEVTASSEGLPDELEDLIGEIHSAELDMMEAGLDPQQARIRDAEVARQEMIKANLRLVNSIAKKYQYRGLEMADLIQEGNLGLMTAVEKFDWRKGFKFSTYATWWIRQSVGRGIANTGRTIRLPVHMIDDVNKLKKSRAAIVRRGEEVTPEVLLEETGWSLKKLNNVEAAANTNPVSLQTPIGEEEDREFGDLIEDPNARPDEDAIEKIRQGSVPGILRLLNERERGVIERRFGLGEFDPQTLDEIGNEFNLTRERIRQIESKALGRLRQDPNAQRLRDS